MPNYRVYFLTPNDHIKTFKVIDCPDDETAISEARQLIDGRDIELWHRTRRIARLTTNDRLPERGVGPEPDPPRATAKG